MIRKDKNGWLHVECANCKASASEGGRTEEVALLLAEGRCGYAVSGKFHFCPSCFYDMLERWKANNHDVEGEVDDE